MSAAQVTAYAVTCAFGAFFVSAFVRGSPNRGLIVEVAERHFFLLVWGSALVAIAVDVTSDANTSFGIAALNGATFGMVGLVVQMYRVRSDGGMRLRLLPALICLLPLLYLFV